MKQTKTSVASFQARASLVTSAAVLMFSSSGAFAKTYGLSLEAAGGLTSGRSSVSGEAPKTGYNLQVAAGLFARFDNGMMEGHLGWLRDSQSGEENGIVSPTSRSEVTIVTRGLTSNLSYLFNIPGGFMVGPQLSMLHSVDAGFKSTPSKQSTALFVGAKALSASLFNSIDCRMVMQALTDMTIANRQITMVSAGVRIEMPLESGNRAELDKPKQSSSQDTVPAVTQSAPIVTKEIQYLLSDESVYFDTDSATLSNSSKDFVLLLGAILSREEFQIRNVTVIGHADITGRKDHNSTLSVQRAAAVSRALQQGGLTSDKLQVHASGDSVPADTRQGTIALARNRRVEIRFEVGANHEKLQALFNRVASATRAPTK